MKTTADKTTRRHSGPTPAGGAYAVSYFSDDDGRPVPEEEARRVEIVEFDADDNEVARTYGRFSQ